MSAGRERERVMNESVNAEAMSHKRGAKYQLDYEYRQRERGTGRHKEREGGISQSSYANFMQIS